MEKVIIIKSIELKDAIDFSNSSYNDKKYGRNAYIQRHTYTKTLLINFIEKDSNLEGYFFTPSFKMVHTEGFLNYKSLFGNTPWMKVVKGNSIGHKNILHYNGSNTPDFLLASYLTGCLHTFNSIVNAREEWYGRGEKRKEKDITDETQIGEQM